MLRGRVQVALLRNVVHPRPGLIIRRTRTSPRRSSSTDARSPWMAFWWSRCTATQGGRRPGCSRSIVTLYATGRHRRRSSTHVSDHRQTRPLTVNGQTMVKADQTMVRPDHCRSMVKPWSNQTRPWSDQTGKGHSRSMIKPDQSQTMVKPWSNQIGKGHSQTVVKPDYSRSMVKPDQSQTMVKPWSNQIGKGHSQTTVKRDHSRSMVRPRL